MIQIERFVCNPFQENCYVVSDGTGEAAIIDCGAFYGEERRAVVDYVRSKGLKPCLLLETHAHIDHNFGNDTIYGEFGLKPMLHASDMQLQERLKEQAMAFAGIRIDYDMPPVGRLLADNDTVTFGSHTLKVVATPGHTPGSVFYHCEEEHVAFSGDTLFNMSIGRTDLEQGSYSDMTKSLGRIVELLPDSTTILPGHGPKTTMGREKQLNPYLGCV